MTLLDSNGDIVGSAVTNTDVFTFELVDACLATSGLTILVDYGLVDWPRKYYYDGHDREYGYGAGVFYTSNANCPVVSYACEELDSSGGAVMRPSCGYGDSTTDTELTFDPSTAVFKFRSSDTADA